MKDFVVFDGGANPELAKAIAHELQLSLGACQILRFPDGEISVQLWRPTTLSSSTDQ